MNNSNFVRVVFNYNVVNKISSLNKIINFADSSEATIAHVMFSGTDMFVHKDKVDKVIKDFALFLEHNNIQEITVSIIYSDNNFSSNKQNKDNSTNTIKKFRVIDGEITLIDNM